MPDRIPFSHNTSVTDRRLRTDDNHATSWTATKDGWLEIVTRTLLAATRVSGKGL